MLFGGVQISRITVGEKSQPEATMQVFSDG